MSTEIPVTLVSLGSAAIGGIATFLVVVYQQKQHAKLAKAQRKDDLSHQAVDKIMLELHQLQMLVRHRESAPESEIDEAIGRIRICAFRLTNKKVRDQIEAACATSFGSRHPDGKERGWGFRAAMITATCMEAQNVLGSFAREEDVPEPLILQLAQESAAEMNKIPRQSDSNYE
ncbi:hypothetical protein KGD83_21750 [Nocardiopsis akebiae]|uniref:Uncharacterized protein n=1 Tax=Nocardiopsis akebiae TaxID=2831968 RepID=A0ABX8C1S3_9ACTN|nr:hypothetical protein [Nocardiopsis akebiae]QUX27880.1 hypothetical protein KGD83_21750 [Nocardiopsis akebiae]